MNPHSSPEQDAVRQAAARRRSWLPVLIVAVVALAAFATYAAWRHFRAPAAASGASAHAASDSRGGAGGAGRGGRRGGFDPNRPMPVTTAAARSGDIDVTLAALGTVTPRATVTVKPRVDGQLVALHFREGETVKAGALLAEIDPRPFQVQLTQAQGQMARDQALLKNARVDLDRYQTLFKQDSIARQQLDTQASLVRQYEGAVEADRGQVENAKLQLSYARVTAPIGGRLGLRQVDVGNVVHASDATGIVVITQVQPVDVVFAIPEDAIAGVMRSLRAGDKLPVQAWDRAMKNRIATGTLLTADNQIDTATGTVKLKAQFTNEDAALFPNQFVNVRLLTAVRHDATVVPAAGIQQGSQGAFVWLVTDQRTVTLRPVKAGATQGDEVEIVSGLKPGDRIVIENADKLRDGAKVSLASDTAAMRGAAAGDDGAPGGRRRRGQSGESSQPGHPDQPGGAGKSPAAPGSAVGNRRGQ